VLHSVSAAAQLLTRGGQLETIEVATNPDGSQSWWLTNKFIFSDSSGKRLVGGLAVDVTQRELSERAIKASEQRFRDLVNATDGMVWEADATTFQFTFISDKAERLLGFPLGDWLQPGFWASNLHPDDKSWAPGYCASCTGRLEPHNFEYRFIARDGRTVWLQDIVTVVAEDGRPRWLRGIMVDITVHKQAAEEMRTLAFYDTLTALPNRRLMRDRLEEAIASSAHDKQRGALMLIDLDNFKKLNDSLGHDMGDQLLIEVARRLLRCVREGDTAARLGGDEFVVILKNLGTTDLAAIQAEHVAENIRCELGHPYALQVTSSQDENNASLFLDKPNTHDYHSTASIGIAVFLGNAASTAELMKRAYTAMYQAKNAGRNACCFFDPINQAKVKAQAELEDDLRSAVARSQFLLHYQAQIGASGDVVGAEVLVRWQHPTRGLVSPAEFIPLAEESGLILPIGYWVLETACKQLAIWAARPETAHLTLAVNVSARQFSLPTFVEEVVALLEYTGATPDKIKLELTESMLLENTENIIAKMTLLKARGIGFSLDDFGTGYSSLSYLKSLPLDQLKIDQSFVRDVLIDASDDAIARTIISLGKSLGLSVIAEGVETAAQRDFLEQAGCHAYQGYFFSKPLPLESFETYLRLKPNLPI
jgi:diguanylate cyclase (GGDEF)-like protein/PAS domain S-box-containing protein